MRAAIGDFTATDRINEIFNRQKQSVWVLRTESISMRKKRLKALAGWIKTNRRLIQQAIYADFRKPEVETDATEIFAVLTEIDHALTNLDRWTKPVKVDAPVTMLGTRSAIVYEPKGVCLIIAPWNYPFNLSIGPLVSALAAGNSAIIKPSELTPATSAVVAKLCSDLFDESVVAVFEGGVGVSQQLLGLPFDHIFFTGSPAIGKVVMQAAAKHLTSVTLELGGKSPVIVTPSVRLRDAARRIAVAKFINNGQTCIAPDYVLVHESVVQNFVTALCEETLKRFAVDGSIEKSPYYARIVNEKHFNRVHELVQDAINKGARVEMSGPVDAVARLIHPVILSQVPEHSRVLEEEIFGPVLPVVAYQTINEAVRFINQKPKPLALYIFGTNKKEQREILANTSSGAACINDCAIHFLHPNLPFGGVNNSGIGKSHGYYGFLAFSNEKPVLRQRSGFTSVQLFYPPYTNRAKKIMDWLIRWM
ncbi:MAG: aldehyde dehydrogenase family protein [Flammeovirgaceae bacterium]|nr:MAG: aldehyde dehydrogenase family protein [Flammeovirgaceae bacterium]